MATPLTRDEMSELDDAAFFEAYKQGRIQRRDDVWTEDNFEEEMEKIPLFMSHDPTPEEFVTNPHLAAMQQAFEQDMDPVERADYHKDHGNKAYKAALKAKNNIKLQKSHVRKALECYTEGLREKCRDPIMDSALLSNRAAANLLIGNNRRVIVDCTQAVQLNRKNIKAYFRAATACHRISDYDACTQWCDRGLALEHNNQSLTELRQRAVQDNKLKAKEERKRALQARKQEAARAKIQQAVEQRGIRTAANRPSEWWTQRDNNDNQDTAEHIAQLHGSKAAGPSVDADGFLSWPVLFAYPEHGQTDFIEAFHEASCLQDHLQVMFPDKPSPAVPWDVHNQYKASKLIVYFEEVKDASRNEIKLHQVDMQAPLLETLKRAEMVVYGSLPMFLIMVKDSSQHKEYLKRMKN